VIWQGEASGAEDGKSVTHARVPCDRCGALVPQHDLTHFTTEAGASDLCTLCLNADVAQRSGIEDFDNHPLTAADGAIHQFHLRTRLLGAIVTLEAYELKDDEPSGYQFQLIGEPDEDRFVQLGRLIERIHRTLATKYLAEEQCGSVGIAHAHAGNRWSRIVVERIREDADDFRGFLVHAGNR